MTTTWWSMALWGPSGTTSSSRAIRYLGLRSGFLLLVVGDSITVTDNTLSDTTGYGIQAATYLGITSTSVTIARNTFTQIGKPIHL